MGPRPRPAPSHRGVRPRYGRILTALGSAGVTTTAVLGSVGVIPGVVEQPTAAADTRPRVQEGEMRLSDYTGPTPAPVVTDPPARRPAGDVLPPGSGRGRRVVFDMSGQRVWLVEAGDRVRRTYLVSGSVTDNLRPGSYEVYSTSRHAVGVDDSGTMEYMVRFAHGENAAIGFHDIPVKDGELVQTRAELGTPQSHGCIRQWPHDARALWQFATVGTEVVVVA